MHNQIHNQIHNQMHNQIPRQKTMDLLFFVVYEHLVKTMGPGAKGEVEVEVKVGGM